MWDLTPSNIAVVVVTITSVAVLARRMVVGARPAALSIVSRERRDAGDDSGMAVLGSGTAASFQQTAPRHSLGALAPVSVLLVEDDDDSRHMLANTLAYYGARVVAVSSAVEALQMLETHHADVLLSDLRLPNKDGFELIHELRSRADPAVAMIPAASITASRRSEDRHHALTAGFHMHLLKPLDPDDLVSTVLTLASIPRPDPERLH